MSFTDLLAREYKARLKKASKDERGFRESAWAAYERLGLPDRKTETWRYSTLNSVSAQDWIEPTSNEVPIVARDLISYASDEFDVAVFVNGELKVADSSFSAKSGYEFVPTGARADTSLVFADGFASAAAAVHRNGYELIIEAGAKLQKPILMVRSQSGENSWVSTLNKITLGEGAEVQIAEVFFGAVNKYLRTDITEVNMAKGARLDWLRTQEEAESSSYFADIQARLAFGAILNFTQINAGALWSRSSIKAQLEGETGEAHINGLSFGRGERHVDQRVEVSHHAPNTTSSQLFKGVLKDRARGVLNGKIFIAKNAQKVMSSQLNHNLLLSPHAEADTKPELEIYADDVKANHGASIGRMDEEKLFYLTSRGIPRALASQMLAQAFVGDVLMKIENPRLRGLAFDRLARILPDYSQQMEGE